MFGCYRKGVTFTSQFRNTTKNTIKMENKTNTHQFWTKEEAETKSESLKHQWANGYGQITGPFQGGKIDGFKRYWEVVELIEPRKRFNTKDLRKENEQLKESLKSTQDTYRKTYQEYGVMLEKQETFNAELLEMLYRIREGKSEYIDKAISKAEDKTLVGS